MIGSVVVLVGPQGIGKTSFWRTLIPRGMKSKGEVLRLGGMKEADTKRDLLSGLVAICDEIGAGLDYSQQEDLKNFLTATHDSFRVAYAHMTTEKPRMTQFVGTSNQLHLRDGTGTRRWLAMDVSRIRWSRMDKLMAQSGFLQQCYAQAWSAVMDDGAQWWLDSEQDDVRAAENSRYEDEAPEIAELEGYLANATGRHYNHEWLSSTQICKLLDIKHTPAKAHRIRDYLGTVCMEFKEDCVIDGHRRRNVFHFPATIDMMNRLFRR
jgi:predicted P-loop ATPase